MVKLSLEQVITRFLHKLEFTKYNFQNIKDNTKQIEENIKKNLNNINQDNLKYNSKLSHLSPIINRIENINFVLFIIYILCCLFITYSLFKNKTFNFYINIIILIIIYIYPFIINPIVMSILNNYDYMYSVIMSIPYVKSE